MKAFTETCTFRRSIVLAVAIAVTPFVSKCAQAGDYVYVQPYLEIGAGYAPSKTPWSTQMGDRHYDWKGDNPVFIGSAGVEISHPALGNDHLDIGVTHISNWFQGAPFNNESETSLDVIHIKYRVRF